VNMVKMLKYNSIHAKKSMAHFLRAFTLNKTMRHSYRKMTDLN